MLESKPVIQKFSQNGGNLLRVYSPFKKFCIILKTQREEIWMILSGNMNEMDQTERNVQADTDFRPTT